MLHEAANMKQAPLPLKAATMHDPAHTLDIEPRMTMGCLHLRCHMCASLVTALPAGPTAPPSDHRTRSSQEWCVMQDTADDDIC